MSAVQSTSARAEIYVSQSLCISLVLTVALVELRRVDCRNKGATKRDTRTVGLLILSYRSADAAPKKQYGGFEFVHLAYHLRRIEWVS